MANRQRAAARAHWGSRHDAALEAARDQLKALGGDEGHANYFAFAFRVEPSCSVASLARRRVTFSRNLTLSLSRTCVSHCKYCAFATHRAHLHEPDEVERLLDDAARRRVKDCWC